MLLELNVIVPLLEAIHSLIKFGQLEDMFVCDFSAIIKICEGDVYQMYCEIHSSFQGDVFINFQALINCVHQSINPYWIINLNTITNYLVFEFVGQHICITFVNQMGAYGFVTKPIYAKVMAFVKR
jgi:hypothetical protein